VEVCDLEEGRGCESEVESLCDVDSKIGGAVGMGFAESTRSRSNQKTEGSVGNGGELAYSDELELVAGLMMVTSTEKSC
jgi:hypothetical protein